MLTDDFHNEKDCAPIDFAYIKLYELYLKTLKKSIEAFQYPK